MIESIVKHILSTTPASDESICMDDVLHYFCDSPAWSKSAAFKRTDPTCLLELKGLAAPIVSTVHELKRFQYRIWHDISYGFFEASAITLYKEASEIYRD